jgi:integrase
MNAPTVRLTDLNIRNLKPRGTERYELPDPGARGLYVIVHPSGKKSFAVRYRHNGQPRKLTLQAGISLAAARKLCADAMHEVAQGKDPSAAKKTARTKAAAAGLNTLANVCEEYFRRENVKLRTAKKRERWLHRLVLPVLGNRQIDSIKRSELVRLLDKIEDTSGQRSADVVLQILQRVMNWHSLRDDNFRSPIVKGMGRYDNQANARVRVLTDDELRKIWRAADGDNWGAFIRFLTLTTARRAEAAGCRYDEIKNGIWTCPASRSKTEVEIVRPLSNAALAIVEAMPRLGEHVFGVDGRAMASFSRRKPPFDAKCGVKDWRLHDLRRTGRTLLSRAGVNVDIAERCLGHSLGTIRSIYDRHSFEPEMRIAFEKLSALIANIVDPIASDRVVPMRKQ